MKTIINTNEAPAAIGPYSQAILVDDMLFASGQIPVDPKTGNIPETIEEQARQSLMNIGAILKEAGMTYDDVLKTTCFLKDMNDFAKFNAVYAEFFTGDKPARSCVAVREIPKGCLCEVEVIAKK